MKKVLSLLLAVVILLSIAVVPAFAETTENNYLYEDKFIECYVEGKDVSWSYDEVYYHNSENQEIDWCLIYGRASNISYDAYVYLKFEDFVLVSSNMIRPFDLKYAVYDVKKETFVDLVDDYDKLSQYDGLIDVLRTLDNAMLMGDTNRDNEITILDATRIQRDIAQIQRLYDEYTDCRGVTGRFSDYNNDGETSILDATAIQRKLAHFENYLEVAAPDEM